MAVFTSAEYLAQIRRALESAMVQLQEEGFDAAQFTDKSIFYSVPDAVDDVNAKWETSYVAAATDTSIAITPTPTRERSRAVCLWTAFLLLSGWASLNLTDGSIGAAYREGLASIDTRGQGVLAGRMLRDFRASADEAVDGVTLTLATDAGSALPIVAAATL